MSQKEAKKLRQLYRRDLEKKVDAQAKGYAIQIATRLAAGKLLKPKPRWLPTFLYSAAIRLVLTDPPKTIPSAETKPKNNNEEAHADETNKNSEPTPSGVQPEPASGGQTDSAKG